MNPGKLDQAELVLLEAARRYSFDESHAAVHALRLAATEYTRLLKDESKTWARDGGAFYSFESDSTTMRGAL